MSFVKLLAIVRRRSLIVALGTLLTMLAVLVFVDGGAETESDGLTGRNFIAVGFVEVRQTAVPTVGNWSATAALTELQNLDLLAEIKSESGFAGSEEELRAMIDFVVGPPILDGLRPAGSSAATTGAAGQAALTPTQERLDGLQQFYDRQTEETPQVISATVIDERPETALQVAEAAAEVVASLGNDIRDVKFERQLSDLTASVVGASDELETFEAEQGPVRLAELENPETTEEIILSGTWADLQQRLVTTEENLNELRQFVPDVVGALYEVMPTPRPREVPTDNPEGPGDGGLLASAWGRLLVGFLLGLGVSSGLAILVERLFPRIDTRADVEDALGLSVIAEVPLVTRQIADRRITLDTFDGPDAEMYRSLRSTLEFLSQAKGRSRGANTEVIMVVSATPAEGKTRSAAMMGMSYAESGYKVALFGCDFRRPRVHELLNGEREPGISTLVEPGGSDLQFDDIIQPTETPGLFLVASGAPTRRTVPSNAVVEQLIAEARRADTNVVIDTAPILVANDSADLLHLVDHVVFVVRSGKTAARAAQEALTVLERHEARVAGVVLIGAPANDGSYYSYYRRYGYYYGRSLDGGRPEGGQPTAGEEPVADQVDDIAEVGASADD